MANSVAGTIIYKLDLDSRDFDRGLDASRDKVKSLGKDAEGSTKRVNTAIGNVAKDSLREINRSFNTTKSVIDEFGSNTVRNFRQVDGSTKQALSSLTGFENRTRRTKDEVSSLRREISQAAGAIRSLQVAFSGFTGAAVIGGITVAAGVLVELAGAALAASGAVLAVPAAAAVAAGAIGTARVALIGLEDAFDAVAKGDAEKLTESLENLSPAAQRFVLATKGFVDAFDPIRRAVQDALFLNLDKEMSRLADGSIPVLDRGLTQVARSMNGLATEAANTVSTPLFQGFLERSLQGTSQAIDTLRGAVNPLAVVLDRVVAAGMPFIQQLTQYVTASLQAGAAFLQTETGMASLETRIRTGVEVLGQIGSLIGAVSTALVNLFSASESSGQTLIQTLTGIVNEFNKWASSAEGQESLANLFRFLNQVLTQSLVIIGAVAGVILSVVNYISTLPEPVQQVIANMVALGIVLTPVIMFFAQFVNSLIALGPVLRFFGVLITTAGSAIFSFGSLIMRVAIQAGAFLLQLAVQALLAGARIAAAMLIAMGPIGWIIAAVVALVAVIALNFDKVKEIATNVWTTVSKFATDAWNGIRATVLGAWNGITSAVSNGVNQVIEFVRGLPRRILIGLGNLTMLLFDAGRQMLEGLGNGINSAVEGVKNKLRDFASGALDTIKNFFGIHSPSRVMAQMGGFLMQGMAQGIQRNTSTAVNAARRASEAALGGFDSNMAINPSMSVGAATALQARSESVTTGALSSSPSSSANTAVNIKVDISGIMTSSQAGKREVAKDLIEAINQELRAKRIPEIGNGAIAA